MTGPGGAVPVYPMLPVVKLKPVPLYSNAGAQTTAKKRSLLRL